MYNARCIQKVFCQNIPLFKSKKKDAFFVNLGLWLQHLPAGANEATLTS